MGISQKFQAVLFGLISLSLPLSADLCGQQPAPTASGSDVPEGWYVYPSSRLNNLDTQQCFNYSEDQWQVTSDGGSIKITKVARRIIKAPSLPPLWKPQPDSPPGLTTTVQFPNAWLLAFDAGEFGGGLWLTNQDGSAAKPILTDNVQAIVPLNGSVLVLSGLVHGLLDFGNAYIFSVPDKLDMSLQFTAHLDSAPRAHTRESDHSVLVATKNGLSRIMTSGTQEELFHFPTWVREQDEKSIVEKSDVVYLGGSRPNSIALGSNGTVFVGMSLFVLRLRKRATGYIEDWLLPNSCRRFQTTLEAEKTSVSCICTP